MCLPCRFCHELRSRIRMNKRKPNQRHLPHLHDLAHAKAPLYSRICPTRSQARARALLVLYLLVTGGIAKADGGLTATGPRALVLYLLETGASAGAGAGSSSAMGPRASSSTSSSSAASEPDPEPAFDPGRDPAAPDCISTSPPVSSSTTSDLRGIGGCRGSRLNSKVQTL
jgi:hypothetical protein